MYSFKHTHFPFSVSPFSSNSSRYNISKEHEMKLGGKLIFPLEFEEVFCSAHMKPRSVELLILSVVYTVLCTIIRLH